MRYYLYKLVDNYSIVTSSGVRDHDDHILEYQGRFDSETEAMEYLKANGELSGNCGQKFVILPVIYVNWDGKIE